MLKIKGDIRIANKKASYLYTILKKYTAAIELKGTEVKAIRTGKVSISEAFCFFKKNELFVKNMNVGEYDYGTYMNHQPNRERKLLLHKTELESIHNKVKEKGLTIVPLELWINERGFIKLDIAVAQGKKVFDKRHSIKDRENKRSMDRMKKSFKIK